MALWYGLEDGYLRIELDDGFVLVVAASWEGVHVYVDMSRPSILSRCRGRVIQRSFGPGPADRASSERQKHSSAAS